MIVLVLAIVSGVLIFIKAYKGLWLTLAGMVGVCGYTFFRFQSALNDLHNSMDTELAGNPFRGIADAILASVGMEWGWALLGIGIGGVLLAAILGGRELPVEPA